MTAMSLMSLTTLSELQFSQTLTDFILRDRCVQESLGCVTAASGNNFTSRGIQGGDWCTNKMIVWEETIQQMVSVVRMKKSSSLVSEGPGNLKDHWDPLASC